MPGTWIPLTIRQMRNIGVDSLPLAGTVAAFIGAVTALPDASTSSSRARSSRPSGWSCGSRSCSSSGRSSPALVLAGRVGARMTAEIGTMRVTEQIDALETLAYDPVAYLVVPRFIAGDRRWCRS